MEKYSPPFVEFEGVTLVPVANSSTDLNTLEDDFTLEELSLAVSYLKDVSPGKDKVHNILLRKLSNKAQVVLLNIFNHLWNSNVIPSSWKEHSIVPIPKPNKDPHQTEGYRPVSISSAKGKLF